MKSSTTTGILSAVLLALALFSSDSFAMSAKTIRSVPLNNHADSSISIRMNAGLINGETHELVYDNDGKEKISKLIWRWENTPMVGLSASIDLPLDSTLSIAGWSQIDNPSSYMEDYDWDKTLHPTDWTHYSNSPANLKRGEMADANLTLPLIQNNEAALSILVGIRHDHWKWADFGGYYVYSSNPGFRDRVGTFPDKVGITYEQWMFAPYLGLQMDWNIEDFVISGRISGSQWAWAKDKDMHIARGDTFRDYFYNIKYISAGLELSYIMTKNLSLALGVDAQKYYRTLGYTKMEGTGGTGYYDNGAGIESESWMTTLSLELRF